MKGIILAGGSGTRLYPVTAACSKQLLPVYDKPMIFHPLSTLMLAGIRDILIISTPHDLPKFKHLLGNGEQIGIQLSYAEQKHPNGLAEAFIIGEKFIGNSAISLILGDNIFFGHGLPEMLQNSIGKATADEAVIFGYYVNDPERYGVVEFDSAKKVLNIEEKPKKAKSNYAVVGLYFYTNEVVSFAKSIKPSARGELEITDINNLYLKNKKLHVELMGRGFAWLDTGTHQSLLDASQFVKTIEDRQGLKIGCIEEVAFRMGFISSKELEAIATKYEKSDYSKYLFRILGEK